MSVSKRSQQGVGGALGSVAIVTLFPEMFAALSDFGVTGRAIANGMFNLHFENPRDYAANRHGNVDDKPYGGGPGMVMAVPPLRSAITAARQWCRDNAATGGERPSKVIYLSPQGQPLTQTIVDELAADMSTSDTVLLCGRYEGIDERVIERDVDREISIGDYVLSGGELPAMVLLDAMIRRLPGALGDDDSSASDSFSGRGLLDFPHYTRPEMVDDQAVPEVLLSGNHQKIDQWRLQQMLLRTQSKRPDLLQRIELDEQEQAQLRDE